MIDERLEQDLSAWLKATTPPSPNPEMSARSVLGRIEPRGARTLTAPVAAIASLSAVVLAVVAVGSLGGFERGRETASVGSAGTAEDTEAIHWQSAVIDLRAADVQLRIGDEVYRGADVDVVDGMGYKGQLMLRPIWAGDERTIWLYLDFVTDERSWSVWNPWLWLDGVIGPDQTKGAGADRDPEGRTEASSAVFGDNVDFDPDGWIGMPLGEAFEGDWQLHGTIEVPTCGSAELESIAVTLTFTDMSLEVTPREPNLFEQLGEDWFHRGSMLGDLVDGDAPRPSPRVLECPPALSTEEG